MAKDYIKIQSPLDLKYDKGNIVASYKYKHKTFRYNLLKIGKSFFLESVSGLKYNEVFTEADCQKAVAKIEEILPLLKKALDEIAESLEEGESIKTKDVKKKMDEYRKIIRTPDGLVNDFTSWIRTRNNEKNGIKEEDVEEDDDEDEDEEEIDNDKEFEHVHPSMKDYISTRNLLMDYQHDKYNRPIQLNDIDNKFLSCLTQYCYETRPKESQETPPYKYKTIGGLRNKTINKRMDCLFTFIARKYEHLPNGIKNEHLKDTERTIIRLDRDELRQLEELDITEERLKIARDYFVFMCYTGLRFSDFCQIDRTYYDKKKNVIHLDSQKTLAECEIFLFDKAKEIGEKYNFRFTHYTNQALNRTLQELFEKYDLYGDEITMKYMQNKAHTKTKKKREWLSCHAGRRTFCSIMAEMGLDLYDLMSATGHKKPDTLKYYIDKFGPARRKRFEAINEKLK